MDVLLGITVEDLLLFYITIYMAIHHASALWDLAVRLLAPLYKDGRRFARKVSRTIKRAKKTSRKTL